MSFAITLKSYLSRMILNSSLILFLIVACIAFPCQAHDKHQLHIAGWDVYADPEHKDKTIGFKEFEDKYSVNIQFTPLNNLDSIVSAAESGQHYDLFIISNEGIKLLHDMDLILPLDLSKINHYSELHHSLRYSRWSQFNGKIYAVPWAWGPTGLLYDADVIKNPDSWNILWNPEYRSRISLWDDVSMIWITALSLGYNNIYSLTRNQLDQVKNKLLKLNNQVYGYYKGEDDLFNYVLNNNVILLNSWFDPSRRLREHDRNFKMIIPKEGAVGMFDSYLISKNSNNLELSYNYINHQISRQVQKQMSRITGLAPSNIETLSLMSADEIRTLHLDEQDYFNKMILWDHMPRMNLYEEVLDEIHKKTGN